MALDRHAVRVLVVDDDPTVARMVAAILEHAGFGVQTAHSGNDALNAIQEQPEAITVLLTDIVMPGMDGVELAEEVHKIAPRLPILFMSGFTGTATPYGPLIVKPFKPADLVAAIESVVAPSRRAPGREAPDATPGAARSA
jgi:DNA-binding response OmpR family regulator